MSASFFIFWDRWNSRPAAREPGITGGSGPSMPPAAIPRAASITIPRTITAGSQRWICSRSLWQAGNCRSIRCAPGRIFSAKIVGKVDNTLFRSRFYIEKVISNFYSRSVCFLMCGGNEKGALRCTLEFATMKLRNCSL